MGARRHPAAQLTDMAIAPPMWAARPVARAQRLGAGALLAALNHVIAQQGWARDRLRGFAGRVIELRVDGQGPVHELLAPPLRARVREDGGIDAVAAAGATAAVDPVAVVLSFKPSIDAAFAAAHGRQALATHLRIEGDVALAAVLGELAQSLRYEWAEDLSRLVGDTLAQRAQSLVAGMARGASSLHGRIRSGLTDYLTAEDRQLVSGRAVQHQRTRLAVLEDRIRRLEARLSAGRPPR